MIKVFLIFAALLTGCAAGPTPQRIAFDKYVEMNRPLANSGKIKWTAYYEGLYSHALAANAPAYVLNSQIELIDVSRKYEAGEIAEPEFQQHRRRITADSQGKYEIESARARDEQFRRNQAMSQAYAQAAAATAANAPKPYMMSTNQSRPYVAPVAGNAYVTGFLRSQSMNGSLRYCNYSNGIVRTIAAHELCALDTN